MGPTSVELSWKESVENNEHLTNCMFELEMSKSKNTSFQNVYRYLKLLHAHCQF